MFHPALKAALLITLAFDVWIIYELYKIYQWAIG